MDRCVRRLLVLGLASLALPAGCAPPQASRLASLERSYWLHASLAQKPHRGYWGPVLPYSEAPGEVAISAAAGLLCGPYAANCLYLLYHKEIPESEARRALCRWRQCVPARVELVPTIVLTMYDKARTPVFTVDEVRGLAAFFRDELRCRSAAVFDVYPNRDQGPALVELANAFPGRLIRVGIQPDEALPPPFASAVQDTWSGFCHGKTNADWLDAGFGADMLRKWIDIRNGSPNPTAWDLIVVAWDYAPTKRGEYPGYDDGNRNMPLPAGRNALAAGEILRRARPDRFAGFSCDLTILHANSASAPHDGAEGSFYRALKRGEIYRGYYGRAFAEVAGIYRSLREGRDPSGGSNAN